MHLRSLNYFATVAETGSVSAAAERLHRSQPALSRAVQELESELGVALFVRHGRRIALSPEGWSVLREAKLVLGSADVLLERARLLSAGRSAVLRIGGAASTVERVLPPLLRTFATQRPDVEVSLTIDSGGRLLESLDRGELDVVFTRETSSETLVSRRLFPMHVVAVVPARHELARRKAVSSGKREFLAQAQAAAARRCTWPFGGMISRRLVFSSSQKTGSPRSPMLVRASLKTGTLWSRLNSINCG